MRAVLGAIVVSGLVALPAPSQRLLVAGPVLAGPRVIWGEQDGNLSVLRGWPDAAPLWQSATSTFAGPLAGSTGIVAFARSFDPCAGQPGVACPVETQALAGRPHGSLRPLAPSERCSAAAGRRRLAVSGSLVAFFALGCDSAAGTVTVRSGSRTVLRRERAGCCDLALAGRFLAWRSGGGIAVVDVDSGQRAFTAAAPAGQSIEGFDVQADGTLAFAFGRGSDGIATLAWRRADERGDRKLGFRLVVPVGGPLLRLVGDRLVAERRTQTGSELVVAGLRGGVRTLARFTHRLEPVGGFDATTERVTWASRAITSTRVDCPPNGQGRPCVLLKSGIETVWLARLASGAPRPIARWAFRDVP